MVLDTSQTRILLPEASEPIDQPTPDDEIPQDELDAKDVSETGVHEYVVSQPGISEQHIYPIWH